MASSVSMTRAAPVLAERSSERRLPRHPAAPPTPDGPPLVRRAADAVEPRCATYASWLRTNSSTESPPNFRRASFATTRAIMASRDDSKRRHRRHVGAFLKGDRRLPRGQVHRLENRAIQRRERLHRHLGDDRGARGDPALETSGVIGSSHVSAADRYEDVIAAMASCATLPR